MRIRNEWKQPVREKHLYLTLAAVILLFGIMGIVFFKAGHVPRISPVLIGIILLVTWAVALVDLLRYGRCAFPLRRLTFLIGVTLMLGSDLLPGKASIIDWMKNVGTIMLVGGYMTSIFDFRKPQLQTDQMEPVEV